MFDAMRFFAALFASVRSLRLLAGIPPLRWLAGRGISTTRQNGIEAKGAPPVAAS